MKKWKCALDLSMSGTAFVLYNTKDNFHIYYVYNCKMPKKIESINKINDNFQLIIERKQKNIYDNYLDIVNTAEHIFNKILELSNSIDIDFYIEDYSLGSKGKIFQIAEFTSLIKYQIVKTGNQFNTVEISKWKKNVVGHGFSTKEKVIDYCDENYQIMSDVISKMINHGCSKYNINHPINDICDAHCILQYFLNESKYK